VFVSLEYESGGVQVIVRPKLKAQLRGPLLRSKRAEFARAVLASLL
jgi:hypothetical protein